jgi:hypothetical protein
MVLFDVGKDFSPGLGTGFDDTMELTAAAAPIMARAEIASVTERVLLVISFVASRTRFDQV